MNNKAYHDDDGVQQERNGEDQRYEHALGVKVLEIRKRPAKTIKCQKILRNFHFKELPSAHMKCFDTSPAFRSLCSKQSRTFSPVTVRLLCLS